MRSGRGFGQFIALAERTGDERVSFCVHDVTSVPLPTGPADLLYGRFLLTHLKEPDVVIAKWATQLQPKGLLLMEEVECIRTEKPVFVTYLEVVDAMLAHQGNKLYIGPTLDSLCDTSTLQRRMSRVVHLRVSSASAATMFFLNMQSWKQRTFVRKNYSSAKIGDLEKSLRALTAEKSRDADIEWGLRQIMCQRT